MNTSKSSTLNILSFKEFCDKNERDFIDLSESDKNKLYDLYERNTVMEQIMIMGPEEFNFKLQNGLLPFFVRANENDSDFQLLYRDTNHPIGPERAYVHREQLRSTTESVFILNNLYTFDEKKIYDDRQICMEKIFSMDEPEFIECLKSNTLPVFELSESKDPDYQPLYREFSANHGDDWAWWNRGQLRSISRDDFIRMCYGKDSF